MTTKMLINASRAQQLRVAIVDGTILQEYQVEIAEKGLCRGNIYRGVVANLQPSLNAAFIDIGEERHGFLPVADVLASAYHKTPPKDVKRPRIDQVLEKGKPILVQVTKDGVGQKGAALSTNLALAGRYLVFTPFDGVRGISRKAADDEARKTIRKRLQKLELPEGHGVIVRTNGLDQNQATLNRDLNALLRLWRKIKTEGGRGRGAKLIYSDQDLVVQSLRDYLDPEIGEVIVDSDPVFEKAQSFMKAFMPRSKTELTRYEDRLPLFSRYRLETQIDQIYQRAAALPSGGYLVIDQTEALTAIDVNSGRATRTSNHDESILNVNIEAAKEVARQLRLRDIGGLIVIDFIDMRLRKHQNKLERVMRDAMKPDKARWSVGRISSNGLLEINRQRIKQALRLRSHHQCPTCEGTGTIPTPEFAAMRLLSKIEARASTQNMASVTIGLHPAMADELQNHYRRDLADLESLFDLEIEIIAAPNLKRSEERIEWVQREGGSVSETPAKRKSAAVSAMDLTSTKRGRGRRRRDDDEERTTAKETVKEARAGARDETQDDADESAKSSKSRRRRRRRKKSSSAGETTRDEGRQVAVAAVGSKGREDEASSTDDASPTRTRRRRRRRGSGPDDADSSTQAAQAAVTDAADGADAAASSTDDDTETSARKVRRRRSRRRRSSDDTVEASTDEATTEQTTEQRSVESTDDGATTIETAADTTADDGSSSDLDDTSEGEAPRRRSRRRRSRRSSERADATGTPEAQTASGADESSDAGDDAVQATAESDAVESDTVESDTVESDTVESDTDEPKKVTRRRRTSRTRRPRRAAEDEAEEQLAVDAAQTDEAGEDDETSIEERAAVSRERRRRRRTRTAASTPDDSSAKVEGEADEATANEAAAVESAHDASSPDETATDETATDETATDEVGGNGHRQVLATGSLEPLDAAAEESVGEDASEVEATESREHPVEASPTPAPPAEGLRWQWWGTPVDPAPEPGAETPASDDPVD